MLTTRQRESTVPVSRSSPPAVSSDKNNSPKAPLPSQPSSSMTSQGRGLWSVLAPRSEACSQKLTEGTGTPAALPGGCLEAPIA